MPLRPCLQCGTPVRNASRCKAHGGPFHKAKQTYQGFSPEVRKAALKRDGYRCTQCGSTLNLEVDHIQPESRGGSQGLANARTLCREHHRYVTAHYDWKAHVT